MTVHRRTKRASTKMLPPGVDSKDAAKLYNLHLLPSSVVMSLLANTDCFYHPDQIPPSDVLCSDAGERGDLEGSFCMSLPARLGAAAVEGAEGLLRIQKPLAGECQASGNACLLSAAASAWQKLRIDVMLMPISFSNTSCTNPQACSLCFHAQGA